MPCCLKVFWWWATFWQIWRNMLSIILSSKLNFLIYWIFLALWLFLVLVCWALYSSISLLGKMAFHHCSFSWFCLQATVSISLNHFHHLIHIHTYTLCVYLIGLYPIEKEIRSSCFAACGASDLEVLCSTYTSWISHFWFHFQLWIHKSWGHMNLIHIAYKFAYIHCNAL